MSNENKLVVQEDSTGWYIVVVSGNNLYQIAEHFRGKTVGNETSYSTTYLQIAELNNIKTPSLIYVNQKIYLKKKDSGGSSPTPTSTSANDDKATVDHFGLQSDADNTLFATWTWGKSNTDHYEVWWDYDTGDGVWFIGNKSNTDEKQSTYTVPSNAKYVRFFVKPISKKYKSGNNEISYWTAQWSTEKKWRNDKLLDTPLETPTIAPIVEIDKYTLKVSLEGIWNNTDYKDRVKGVCFQVVTVTDGKEVSHTRGNATVSGMSGVASFECTITTGEEYKVRYYVYETNKSGYWSDWSTLYPSEAVSSIPAAASGIKTIRAESKTSVHLEWDSVKAAKGYDIQHAEKKDYFTGASVSPDNQSCEGTTFLWEGLEAGKEHFFRIRAKNDDGESAWSDIKSVVIGTKPSAPTTWSSTTTAVVGEKLTIHWLHNSEDGSKEKYANICIRVNGRDNYYEIQAPTSDDDEDDSSSIKDEYKFGTYEIDTSTYSAGAKLQWWVRTKGATGEYGDWSILREIDIYSKPSLSINVIDKPGNNISTLSSFPFYVKAVSGNSNVPPTGYHLEIIANESHNTVDNLGNPKTVSEGDAVYSKHFNSSDYKLLVGFSAGNINLENNISYTAKCIVSMTSGLTAEASDTFTVGWTEVEYAPNAEISIDVETLSAYIRPYCDDHIVVNKKVEYDSGKYVTTTETLGSIFYGETVNGAITETGEQVYTGVDTNEKPVYYCEVEEISPITDVKMDVYRREFDGSFTELAVGLDSSKNTTIVDPHPALDFARYRIVATHDTTGAVSYYDIQGYSVGGKSVIIQWDENWNSFESTEAASLAEPSWSGSMLKLPYNIDVSDSVSPDVELIKYIGREHPVTYYGTQIGQTASWNVVIPKDDKNTLYGLRRLARWMSDVYVREPSGSGYWANIKVSFNQKHDDLTIPVSLSITRVEGGV